MLTVRIDAERVDDVLRGTLKLRLNDVAITLDLLSCFFFYLSLSLHYFKLNYKRIE